MELPEINEVTEKPHRTDSAETEIRKTREKDDVGGKECIYYKGEKCSAPDCNFKACAGCPNGYMYTFAGALKDIFQRVIALAIFFLKSDDVLRDIIAVVRGVEVEMDNGARSAVGVKKLNNKVDEIAAKIKTENKD